MGRQERRRALHLHQHQNAAEQCGRSRRCSLSSDHRFHSSIERSPAGREEPSWRAKRQAPHASVEFAGRWPLALRQLDSRAAKPNPLDKLTPVTDAELQNPPPGEWLTWRRTYDDQGFSPLKQINKSNVAPLRSRLELVAIAGRQRSYAAGPRWRDLRAQLRRPRASPRRRHRRPALGIFARNCLSRKPAS